MTKHNVWIDTRAVYDDEAGTLTFEIEEMQPLDDEGYPTRQAEFRVPVVLPVDPSKRYEIVYPPPPPPDPEPEEPA